MTATTRSGQTRDETPEPSGCAVCAGTAGSAEHLAHGALPRRQLLRGAAGAAVAAGASGLLGRGASAGAARPERGEVLRTTRRARQASTLVLEPSWVLVYRNDDVELVRAHSVVVQDGHIAEIVDGRVTGNDERIDMAGQLLIPGMISGHTHVALGSPTRGIIESGRFFTEPGLLTEELDGDDLDAVTAYNLAEILRAGCTTQLEQSLSLSHAQSYVRVARRWGVRGYPGGMVPTWSRTNPIRQRENDDVLLDSVAETLDEVQANLDFALTVNGAEDGRILPMMAPHGPETHTPETLTAVIEAARQLGTGIHTHLATVAGDSANVARAWGKGPVTWIDEFGYYDVPMFGAHMSGWDIETDLPFLSDKAQFTFAHCPSGAGAGFGSGASQPYIEALAAGFNVCVALDSHSNDMLENAKLAVLYGRTRYDLTSETSPVPVKRPTVWDMIKSVTLYPANGLGRDDLGRIAVGAKADLTSIDVSGLLVGSGTAPPEPLNNLLYASGPHVRNVLTEGVLQVADGQLVIDDEQQVVERGAAVVQRIWDQLDADGWFTPTDR